MDALKVRTVRLRMVKRVDVAVNIEVKATSGETDEQVMEEMRLRFEDNADESGWFGQADLVETVDATMYEGPRHGQRFRRERFWTVRTAKLLQNDAGVQKVISLMLDALAAGAPIESLAQAMEDEIDAAGENMRRDAMSKQQTEQEHEGYA